MMKRLKRWSGASSPISLLAATLVVTFIVLRNLETFFPIFSQSGDAGAVVAGSVPSSAINVLYGSLQHGSQAVPKHDLNWPTSSYFEQQHRRSNKIRRLPGRLGSGEEVFECDRSHPRTDVCHLKGDVRIEQVQMNSSSSKTTPALVLYATNTSTPIGVETMKPYTRKWEQSCMDIVHEVQLRSVRVDQEAVESCEVVHTVPAVVMTTGGYTGNVYHEFHDGLIPLFITLQHLRREVVIIVVEYHSWWHSKYEDVLHQLTKFPLLDFEATNLRKHCFPEVTVGLHIHDELTVDPALMPHNETIRDFRALLDRAYRSTKEQQQQIEAVQRNKDMSKPRLVMVIRKDTRVILNLEKLVAIAEEIGLEVQLIQPAKTSELSKLYHELNASDIMVGVHGAAMTHFLFMRPGSVFVQIIPLGTTWAADAYYGQPAKKLGLQYIGYHVKPYESSLSDKYAKNDTVLTNPDLVAQGGWSTVKHIYLEGQDVRPSPARFRKTLLRAKAKALAFMQKQVQHKPQQPQQQPQQQQQRLQKQQRDGKTPS